MIGTFEVDETEAPDRWRSVIAEGTFEEIDDPRPRNAALAIIYGADGVPDLGTMAVHRGRVFVQVRRVSMLPEPPPVTPVPLIAVVDLLRAEGVLAHDGRIPLAEVRHEF